MKTTSYLDFQSVCNVSKRQNEHSQMTVGRRQGRSCNDAGDGEGCNPGARARTGEHEGILGGRQV